MRPFLVADQRVQHFVPKTCNATSGKRWVYKLCNLLEDLSMWLMMMLFEKKISQSLGFKLLVRDLKLDRCYSIPFKLLYVIKVKNGIAWHLVAPFQDFYLTLLAGIWYRIKGIGFVQIKRYWFAWSIRSFKRTQSWMENVLCQLKGLLQSTLPCYIFIKKGISR